MEKYNKFLRNITELIEKGLYTSKDLKKAVEEALKFKAENIEKRSQLIDRLLELWTSKDYTKLFKTLLGIELESMNLNYNYIVIIEHVFLFVKSYVLIRLRISKRALA